MMKCTACDYEYIHEHFDEDDKFVDRVGYSRFEYLGKAERGDRHLYACPECFTVRAEWYEEVSSDE